MTEPHVNNLRQRDGQIICATTSFRIGAAALNDQTADGPRLDRIAGFADRRIQCFLLAILISSEYPDGRAILASILDACFLDRSAVRVAGVETGVHLNAFSPFGSAFACIAPALADTATRPAVVSISHDVCANSGTCRLFNARQDQIYVLADLVRTLIVELGTKDSRQVHPLELDRVCLMHRIPGQRDRVGAFLPRGHERSIPDHPAFVRQRPSDDVVYPVRVCENRGEDDRLSSGYLRDIGLEAEKNWCSRCRCRGRRSGIARFLGYPGTRSYRVATGTHGRGCRGCAVGLFVSAATDKDSRDDQELERYTHGLSLSGSAEARKPRTGQRRDRQVRGPRWLPAACGETAPLATRTIQRVTTTEGMNHGQI